MGRQRNIRKNRENRQAINMPILIILRKNFVYSERWKNHVEEMDGEKKRRVAWNCI